MKIYFSKGINLTNLNINNRNINIIKQRRKIKNKTLILALFVKNKFYYNRIWIHRTSNLI